MSSSAPSLRERLLDLARRIGPTAVLLIIFAVAAAATWHFLSSIDLKRTLGLVLATPPHVMALALMFTAVGYAGLIGYDWSALRHMRRKLPMRVIALGGFVGYAFGNSLGASAVSGGAARYRVYSPHGLSLTDIAGIALFSVVAYGVGATLIGLVALAASPHAFARFTPIPAEYLRLTAIMGAALMVGVLLLAAKQRWRIRFKGFPIRAPRSRLLGWQLVFTVVDILGSGAALYVLSPDLGVGFLPFVSIYAAALMLGVASHTPGGVGVFEAVMISALPVGNDPEPMAAALLLFRIIYFLLPLGLAMGLMAAREAGVIGAARRK